MKPNFRGDRWRRPKGLHSKVRLSKKGNVGLVRKGRSKGKRKKERIKLVHNIKELKNNKEVIIARVGLKKKIALLKEAEKKQIKILNIKNPKEFLKKIEEEKKKKEEEKKGKKKKKEIEVKKEEEKKKEKLDEKLKKEEIKKEKKEERKG